MDKKEKKSIRGKTKKEKGLPKENLKKVEFN